jgi:hypothetical protein
LLGCGAGAAGVRTEGRSMFEMNPPVLFVAAVLLVAVVWLVREAWDQ